MVHTRNHNCPSMMFQTRCCLHPKCKHSYLLIYITSGSYVNKINVRYLHEILELQIAAKQLQLATWLLLTAYRNLPTPYPTVPSPTLYNVPFSHNTKRYRQTDRRRPKNQSTYLLGFKLSFFRIPFFTCPQSREFLIRRCKLLQDCNDTLTANEKYDENKQMYSASQKNLLHTWYSGLSLQPLLRLTCSVSWTAGVPQLRQSYG